MKLIDPLDEILANQGSQTTLIDPLDEILANQGSQTTLIDPLDEITSEQETKDQAVTFMKKAGNYFQKKANEPKKEPKPEKTPFDMPKDLQDKGYIAGAKKQVVETVKGIPQIPKNVVKGIASIPKVAKQRSEERLDYWQNLLKESPENQEESLKEELGKTTRQVADITSFGLGPVGYGATRIAKGVGMRRKGATKEQVGEEITGDALVYGTVLGTRKFIKSITGKSIGEIKNTKTVEVDPAKVKDLYSRVTTGGTVSPQERAIYQSLADSGQLSSALKNTKPFKIEIPKGVPTGPPKFKPQPKPTGPQVSGPPTVVKPTVQKPPIFPTPKGDELPIVKPQKDLGRIGIVPESYQDYEKTIEALKTGLKKTTSTFDVEKPFKDAGAPDTGLAIKTLMSKMAIGEEKSLDFVKNVNELDLSKKDIGDLAFMAEKSIPTTPKAQKAVDYIRKELDSDLELLKKRGALKTGFPDSMIERLEAEKLTAKKADITAIDSKIARLRDVQYMPIQLKVLMEDVVKDRLAEGKSIKDLPVFNSRQLASFKDIKGRKSITLKDLVDSGLVPKEKADARALIATYKRYIYTKLAEKDIVDNAIKEKIAVPSNIAPDNFVEIPTRYAPDLKDHKVDPVFADYLADTFGSIYNKGGVISKATSIVKMLQFYNPLFLPLNDVTQGAMLGSMQTPKLPKHAMKAFDMMINRTPEYYEALENGLASTPHKNPFKVYKKELDKVMAEKDSVPARVINNLKRYGKTGGVDLIGDLYSLSWNVAWKLDKTVRFMSYNYLRDKGHTPKDAAQTAASFHGDYAGVPAKTRRALNNVLFTPTFKIAMTKLYGEMLVGATKSAGGKNATPKNKAFAKGLLWTASIIMGRRLFMDKLGFKEEEFNRKYSLPINTSAGKKKLTMSFADPTNIPMRYYYRFMKVRPEDLNLPARIWQGITYELTPLWKMAINFKENKKYGGGQIYKPFDDASDQWKDISQWGITETVGILKPFLKKKTKKDKLLAEGIRNSAYPLLLNILKIYTFQYGGDLDFQRNAFALKRLQRQFQTNEKSYFLEEDTKGFENRLNNFLKRIKKITGRGSNATT